MMEGGDISSDGELNISSVMEPTSKKRKSYGRIRDVKKKMSVQSHEMGPDCNCLKKCFDVVLYDIRNSVLKQFNMLGSTDAQNLYLCGLIAVLPVQRKTFKEGAKHYGASYKYRIRALVGENTKEFNVCRKAFIAIHGISKKKVEILVSSLKETGYAPQDKRDKHPNHLNKLSVVRSLVRQHINSFKGRGSHYSLKPTKIHLTEELNVKKCIQCLRSCALTIKYPMNRMDRCFVVTSIFLLDIREQTLVALVMSLQ